jgi:hypothetical protein
MMIEDILLSNMSKCYESYPHYIKCDDYTLHFHTSNIFLDDNNKGRINIHISLVTTNYIHHIYYYYKVNITNYKFFTVDAVKVLHKSLSNNIMNIIGSH